MKATGPEAPSAVYGENAFCVADFQVATSDPHTPRCRRILEDSTPTSPQAASAPAMNSPHRPARRRYRCSASAVHRALRHLATAGLVGRLSTMVGRLRGLWLLWAAVAVQAAQFSFDGARVALLVVVDALVVGWLVLNLLGWRPAMRAALGVVLVGLAINTAVIVANGRMPYSPQAAAQAGLPAGETTAKNMSSNHKRHRARRSGPARLPS